MGTKRPLWKTLYNSSRKLFFFSRQDHVLGHKTNLNKFKRTEIIQNRFSNHNGIKLEENFGNSQLCGN